MIDTDDRDVDVRTQTLATRIVAMPADVFRSPRSTSCT